MTKFGKGSKHTKEAKRKISRSLKGKFGELSRRWKGRKATYSAKHMWIVQHYGRAAHCEHCGKAGPGRYEWANISGKYKREREDWMPLCPSCHRLFDHGKLKLKNKV